MRLRRVHRQEKGQSTLEYAAILAIIAFIIVALMVMATPMGRRITCQVQSSLDKILGGNGGACSSADTKAEEDKHKPKGPCVKKESSREKKVSGTFFVEVQGGGRIKVEEMSDGTYRVTETGILRASYSFSAPEISGTLTYDGQTQSQDFGKDDNTKVEGKEGNKEDKGGKGDKGKGGSKDGDKGKKGLKPSGSAEVGASGEGSRVFTVGNKEEKDKLVDYLQNQVDNTTLTAAYPPVGAAKMVWDWGWDNSGARTYTPPPPTEYSVQAGADGTLEGNVNMGPVSAGASGTASAALGATFHKDGGATYFYSAAAEVGANGKLEFANVEGPSANGKAKAENIIAVTVDKEGKPTKMNVTTALDAKGSTSGGDAGKLAEVLAGKDPAAHSGEIGRVYSDEIDMTDPRAAQIGLNYMAEAGIPAYGLAKMATGDSAIEDFYQEAHANGQSTRREMTTDDKTNFGIGFKAKGDGFNFGAGYTDTTSNVNYQNSEYWNGERWVKWEGC